MTEWPLDTLDAKMAFYGDFHLPTWASANLIHIVPPFKMFYERKQLDHGILVHRKCADAMMAAFTEIWNESGKDQTAVDKTGASDYGGCFNIRRIAMSNEWTNHCWACAIDLSPTTNGFRYDNSTTLSNVVVSAFKKQGARWGGDYHGRKDPMHFEFVRPA